MRKLKEMKKILSSWLSLMILSSSFSLMAEVQLLDRMIAIVDEGVVLESELVRRTNAVISQIKARGQKVPSLKLLRNQVLERLIIESLQLQTAQRVGVRIGDRELTATIERVAEGSKLSLEEFKSKIESEGTAWTVFREDLRNEIMISRVVSGMVQRRIQISEKEIDNLVAQMDKEGESRTQYHLGHIMLALSENATPEQISKQREQAEKIIAALRKGSSFEEFAIAFSDAQDSLEGGDMGWRGLSQLPTLFAGTVKNMDVKDVSEPLRSGSGLHIIYLKEKKGGFEAQVVVQTHVRHILVSPNAITTDKQAFDKISLARDRILKGEDFGDLAKEISDDKSNAAQGGDMSWIDPGVFVKEFSAVMDKLPLNELSKPVKTQFGWHLIEVLGRRDKDQTEDKKRERAFKILSNRKFEEESQTWISELKEKSHIKIIDQKS
ncbi:MAG: peptidylprolyl isomerase [Enterobacterales bacterium]|nr:peptidylprolyl isomerase [Enterobacterales bacterium]